MERCPGCPNKAFQNRKLLKHHLGKEHGYMTVICPYCFDREHTFKRVFDLKVHCDKKHVESKELPRETFTETNAFYLGVYPKKYAEYCVKADRLSPIAVKLRTLMLRWVANCRAPMRTRAEILEGWDADDDFRMPIEIRMVDPPECSPATTMEVLHISLNLNQIPHADLKDGQDKIRALFTPDLYDDKLAMRSLARIMARTKTTIGHLRFDASKAETDLSLKGRVSTALRIHSSLISTIKVSRVVFEECSSPKRARIAPMIEPNLPEAACTEISPQSDVLGDILQAQSKTHPHSQDLMNFKVTDTRPLNISADQIMQKAAEIAGVINRSMEATDTVTSESFCLMSDEGSQESSSSVSVETPDNENTANDTAMVNSAMEDILQQVVLGVEHIQPPTEQTLENTQPLTELTPGNTQPPTEQSQSVHSVTGDSRPEIYNSDSEPVNEAILVDSVTIVNSEDLRAVAPIDEKLRVDSVSIVKSVLNGILQEVADRVSSTGRRTVKLASPNTIIKNKVIPKKRTVSVPKNIGVISTMNSSELSVPVPKNKSMGYRATKLLRIGAMPLFPPARRDWREDEIVTLREGSLEFKWPPKQWKQMSPDQKLLQQEFLCMQIIKERLGTVLKVDRTELLESFNFLALPGSKSFHLHSTEQHSRYHIFTTLVAISKGRRLDQWLAMMEGVTICRDTSNDALIKACSKVPLRL